MNVCLYLNFKVKKKKQLNCCLAKTTRSCKRDAREIGNQRQEIMEIFKLKL